MKLNLSRLFYRIRYSIGFYPTIISTAYFVFALIVVALPSSDFWDTVKPFLEWKFFPKVGNDKVVLSTLITGIISLIAFSFAMVMVVLSNVATAFSPKLILGLVTEKTHQVVLGNYIGAILYCLMLLLMVSDARSHQFLSMAIILAALMGIWCLVLFIYFIHKISTSVQIINIVEQIHNRTKKELLKKQKADTTAEIHRRDSVEEKIVPRYVFPSRVSGYLQKADTEDLVRIAGKYDLVIRVSRHMGDFIVKGAPFMTCTKAQEDIDSTVLDGIYGKFTFFSGEKIEINARYGFTQLMEIAIKALSPGINDPGTACICIDYLADLFALWKDMEHSNVYYDENKNPRLIITDLDFETLFTLCFGPIRRYGREDLLIANKLLQSFQILSHLDRRDKYYKEILNEEATKVIEGIKSSSSSGNDLRFLYTRILKMNEDLEDYFRLPLDF